MKKTVILTASAAAAAAVMTVILLFLRLTAPAPLPAIGNFNDCVRAGYPVMESYPEQCRTPDGRTFVRTLPQNDSTEVPAAAGILPADSSEPAAGICAASDGEAAVLTINADAPSPRCMMVRDGQKLEVRNGTIETIRVWFGEDERLAVEIPPGGYLRNEKPVEQWLAPGIHFLHGYPYPGPEVWLRPAGGMNDNGIR